MSRGEWEFTPGHILTLRAQAADIDGYGHVNNAVYMQWLDRTAWSHSTALGVSTADCLRLRRGMVVQRAELNYLRGAGLHDTLQVATRIVECDGKLRAQRRFQIWRPADAQTLLRATLDYVCMNLDSGRAARMPAVFSAAYRAGTNST